MLYIKRTVVKLTFLYGGYNESDIVKSNEVYLFAPEGGTAPW
jgi:hypothetical protein